jgi:hypothetical protein
VLRLPPRLSRAALLNEARIDWLTAGKYVEGTLPAGGVGPFGPYVSKPSNYDAIVTAAANEAGGQGFVTDLGGPASQYRTKVWSSLDDEEFRSISMSPLSARWSRSPQNGFACP